MTSHKNADYYAMLPIAMTQTCCNMDRSDVDFANIFCQIPVASREEIAMKYVLLASVAVFSILVAGVAPAKAGCVSGAAAGGFAGHFVGHPLFGAAIGCAIGHHEAKKHAVAAQAREPVADQADSPLSAAQSGYGLYVTN